MCAFYIPLFPDVTSPFGGVYPPSFWRASVAACATRSGHAFGVTGRVAVCWAFVVLRVVVRGLMAPNSSQGQRSVLKTSKALFVFKRLFFRAEYCHLITGSLFNCSCDESLSHL